MNWSGEIAPAILAILSGVEGIGKTYKSERTSHFIETHKALLVKDGIYHVWWPILLGWNSEGSRQHQILREYFIEVVGLRVINNEVESREIFEDLTLRVADAFDSDANYGLGGLIQFQTPTTAAIQAEAVQYGGVLCHRAAVRFSIRESHISE